MAWKLAPCLVKLREEVNAKYPGRDKASDGSIGDSAHSSRTSDHNPDARGIVHAIDIDKDLFPGSDAEFNALVEKVANDPRIKYTIWRRRIKNPGEGWRKYNGSNPHDKHAHFSATVAGENKTSSWLGATTPPKPVSPVSDVLSAGQIKWLAQQEGIMGEPLVIATAVGLAESDGNVRAHNTKGGDDSYSIWQINMKGDLGPDRRKRYGLKSDEDLYDPRTNARVMAGESRRGTNWKPWGAFTDGRYLKRMDEARAAQPIPLGEIEEEGMALVLWSAEGSNETWSLIEGRPCKIRQGRDLDRLMEKYRDSGLKTVDLGPKMTPEFHADMMKGAQ